MVVDGALKFLLGLFLKGSLKIGPIDLGLVSAAMLQYLYMLYLLRLNFFFLQVYESNKKLAIQVEEVSVTRPDFERALRKIVCSTHRVEDKLLGPLPRHIRPLLQVHSLHGVTCLCFGVMKLVASYLYQQVHSLGSDSLRVLLPPPPSIPAENLRLPPHQLCIQNCLRSAYA